MFWVSCHFADQNKNPVKCLQHYLKIQCLPIGAHLSECTKYHKVGITENNLASIILQSTKKFKNFKIPILFVDQYKNIFLEKNIPWKFCVW